jgi:hypothetical protein
MVTRLAEPPQRVAIAGEVTPLYESVPRATILSLPCILRELTVVQRHVLTCVAVHHWNFGGSIPYRPPTTHQAGVARLLAGPEPSLLSLVGGRRPSFRLSRLGEVVGRRVVPGEEDRARERTFDQMRALMRNTWEVTDGLE